MTDPSLFDEINVPVRLHVPQCYMYMYVIGSFTYRDERVSVRDYRAIRYNAHIYLPYVVSRDSVIIIC